MKKYYTAFSLLFLTQILGFSQTTFQHLYGTLGTINETAYSGFETPDGGYVINGTYNTSRWGMIKLNSSGNLAWSKTFNMSGVSNAQFRSMYLTPSDSGFTLNGYGTIGSNSSQFLTFRVDSTGSVSSVKKSFGGANIDQCFQALPVYDGGSIMCGYSSSITSGGNDFYLVRFDNLGNKLWDNAYGSQLGAEIAYSICKVQTEGGGFVFGGNYSSIIKIDTNGLLLWQKSYKLGTNINSSATIYSVQETSDKGLILMGNVDTAATLNQDIFLLKTDSLGIVQWTKVFGGTSSENGRRVIQTPDNGYIIAGQTQSYGHGSNDAYLIKTDGFGNLQWSKTYGSTNTEIFNDVRSTSDGGYFAVGASNSDGAGSNDYFIVKTDSKGNSIACNGTDPSTGIASINTFSSVTSYTTTTGSGNPSSLSVAIASGTFAKDSTIQPTAFARIDTAICKYDTLQLTMYATDHDTLPYRYYAWSPSSLIVGTKDVKNDSAYAVPLSTTVFSAIVSNKFCYDTAHTTITVSILPTVIATTDINSICLNSTSAALKASGATNYFWTPSEGLSFDNIATPSASPSADVLYTVTGYLGACFSSDSLLISVNTTPTVSIISKSIICYGQSTQLTAGGGTYYYWSPITNISSPIIANPIVTPPQTTTYNVIISNGFCQDSAFITVLVNEPPIADFTFADSIFTNNSQNGSSFKWYFGDGDTSTAVNPKHKYSNYGAYNVTLIAYNTCYNDTITQTFYLLKTGINSVINESSVSVYPNPNNGSFTLQLPPYKGKELDLKLRDLSGRIVFEEQINGTETSQMISFSNLAKGIYSLFLNNNEVLVTKKIVIL